jgi:hypothetical protein
MTYGGGPGKAAQTQVQRPEPARVTARLGFVRLRGGVRGGTRAAGPDGASPGRCESVVAGPGVRVRGNRDRDRDSDSSETRRECRGSVPLRQLPSLPCLPFQAGDPAAVTVMVQKRFRLAAAARCPPRQPPEARGSPRLDALASSCEASQLAASMHAFTDKSSCQCNSMRQLHFSQVAAGSELRRATRALARVHHRAAASLTALPDSDGAVRVGRASQCRRRNRPRAGERRAR